MRLAEFILANVEPIVAEWEGFAQSLAPGAEMQKLALRDDAEAILRATARDMQADQSLAQQHRKSKGHGGAGGDESDRLDNASALHGVERVGSGFDIREVVSEYRALRASVLRLWRESVRQPDVSDLNDVTRFNESIDQSLGKAVDSYTRRVDQSRRMFLAILSHDLRNPLNCIRMATQLASATVTGGAHSAEALSLIETQTQAMARLISDLTDFASTGLGSAIPLSRGPVDLEVLCHEVIDGFRSAHSDRRLRFQSHGDLTGEWDAGRLRQVISNLLGNALQHGSAVTPIELTAHSDGEIVVLNVHNEGPPIPPAMLKTIFDPLVREVLPGSDASRTPGSIGLGLYIVREIVHAHGGTVELVSTHQEGTRFTIRIPRLSGDRRDRRGETSAPR